MINDIGLRTYEDINMVDSVVKQENIFDANKRTAVIYNIPDIAEYIVEIHFQSQSYFIKNSDNQNTKFGNLGSAKDAAKSENAEIGYLAVSNLYDSELSTQSVNQHSEKRFDYMPIQL